jgi:hypothetical protein
MVLQKYVLFTVLGLMNADVNENTFNQMRSTYNGANNNPNPV